MSDHIERVITTAIVEVRANIDRNQELLSELEHLLRESNRVVSVRFKAMLSEYAADREHLGRIVTARTNQALALESGR